MGWRRATTAAQPAATACIGFDKADRARPDRARRVECRGTFAPTRSTIAIAARAFGAVSAAAAQTWTKVRIGTEGAYPPWNHADSSGELIGSGLSDREHDRAVEIDLARDLCARMQVECELIVQDWASMIPALRAGAHDAIMAGMPITESARR